VTRFRPNTPSNPSGFARKLVEEYPFTSATAMIFSAFSQVLRPLEKLGFAPRVELWRRDDYSRAATFVAIAAISSTPHLLLEHPMAKRAPEPKPATQAPEEKFVELMLVAADFVKSCGSLEQAKKALTDAGNFIQRAGSVASAERALSVLESLKEKIG